MGMLSPTPPIADGNHKLIQVGQDVCNAGDQRTQIITMQGHEIILLDNAAGSSTGNNKIQITTSNGKIQIRLDEKENTLYLGAVGDTKIVVEADGQITAKSRSGIDMDAPIINLNCVDTSNISDNKSSHVPTCPGNMGYDN